MRVLIVGAGPTGLAAGVELARRHIDVTVIDKRNEASGFSRAVGILQSTLDFLEASGVAKALRDEGIHVTGARFFDHAKPVFQFDLQPKQDDLKHSFLLCLPQDRTEFHLREAFIGHGGILKMGLAFFALDQDESGVGIKFGDGTSDRFDYVLGADGIGSPVRKALGIPFDGYDLPEDWSIADAFVDGWAYPDKFVIYRMGGKKVVICVPMAPQRVRFISNTPDALALLPIKPNITELKRSGTFKISIRQVSNYQQGRVFLAGDAAHAHSPVGGRGMNLGIADACEFAKCLAENNLEGYSQSRHAEGAKIIAMSERVRKIVMSESPITRVIFINTLKFAGYFSTILSMLARRFVLR